MLIKVADFHRFLQYCQTSKLDGYERIFVPVFQNENDLILQPISDTSKICLDKFRAQDPAKILFYHFRESVSRNKLSPCKSIIAGLKSCDLKAIKLLDTALINNDFFDPAYLHWRQSTLLITCDCNDLSNSCHCSLLNLSPYAESGFDVNLSRLDDQYFIKWGSEDGKRFIDLLQKHFSLQPADSDIHTKVEKKRTYLTELLNEKNKEFLNKADYRKIQTPKIHEWVQTAEDCIGCGACTNICPTCYCLILNDESQPREFIKVRSYDSCQLNGYARVAGGATPRPKMKDRFRNRYLCKFCYMESNFNEPGCTGCGRCIDACPAGIDIREIVTKITAPSDQFPKHQEQHA